MRSSRTPAIIGGFAAIALLGACTAQIRADGMAGGTAGAGTDEVTGGTTGSGGAFAGAGGLSVAGGGGVAGATVDAASADASGSQQVVSIGPPAPAAPTAAHGTIFVAVNGSDQSGDGSKSNPFASLSRAYGAAAPGAVIMLRGGSYSVRTNVIFDKAATDTQTLVVMSYPGERAVLDFAQAPDQSRVFLQNARFHVIRDLEVRNSRGQGFFIADDSSDNLFANVVARDANGSGFQIFRGSRNKFFDCLAIFTRAPAVPGDADGFGSIGRGGPSEDNQFIRCVSVNAPDDDFDSWEGRRTLFWGSIALRAGRFGGNGNGFKTGPGPGAPNTVWSPPPPAATRGQAAGIIRQSLAAFCESIGFDSNGGAANRYDNNTSVRNGTAFAMYTLADIPSRTNHLRNNLALGQVVGLDDTVETTNSWNAPPGVTIATEDFADLEAPPDAAFAGLSGVEAYALLTTGAHRTFARLAPTSKAIDRGTSIDLPFTSAAPDLGAYELER